MTQRDPNDDINGLQFNNYLVVPIVEQSVVLKVPPFRVAHIIVGPDSNPHPDAHFKLADGRFASTSRGTGLTYIGRVSTTENLTYINNPSTDLDVSATHRQLFLLYSPLQNPPFFAVRYPFSILVRCERSGFEAYFQLEDNQGVLFDFRPKFNTHIIASLDIFCGECCPEGTFQAESVGYPGYECIPYSEIEKEIREQRRQINRLGR